MHSVVNAFSKEYGNQDLKAGKGESARVVKNRMEVRIQGIDARPIPNPSSCLRNPVVLLPANSRVP